MTKIDKIIDAICEPNPDEVLLKSRLSHDQLKRLDEAEAQEMLRVRFWALRWAMIALAGGLLTLTTYLALR